jgi:hypothetical protein
MKPTFNNVSRNKYRPPVAVVYGTDRGVQFRLVYKTMRAALRCAEQFRGFVVPV